MRLFFIFLLTLCSACPANGAGAENNTLAIIISAENSTKSLSKSELSLIYWRKQLFWSNGLRIQAVNFSSHHPLRMEFSKRVLKSLPDTQTDYWNGLYYHGISPPHVVESYEAAIRFIEETKGGIAYVPACAVDARVKTLVWLDDNGQLTDTAPNCEN